MAEKKARIKLSLQVNKIVIPILFLLPLLLLVFPIYDLVNSKLIIFPTKDIPGRLMVFTDRGFKGSSVIDFFSYVDGVMEIQYTLKKGANSPMVFIIMSLGTPEKPLNVSEYKSVSITVRESTSKSIRIYVKTFVPGISSSEATRAITLRHNSYLLKLIPGVHEYTFGFSSLTTGQWWFDTMRITSSELPNEKFSKLISFDLQFNLGESNTILNQHQKTVIEEIAFNKPLLSFNNRLILGFLALLYSGLGTCAVVRKFLILRQVIPEPRSINVTSYKKQDLTRIREFIETHYSDPEISTRMLYKSLGIPPEKIFALVLSGYGITFKQLINKMRIKAAKRLLRESDLRISEIAMNTGFNEPTYFNRLFKKYEGITPSEFRRLST